jgi:Dyp-type peroxidase family
MRHFRAEFIQGMATEYRARILGDLEESAASNWRWGGPEQDELHAVLMIYAADKIALKSAEKAFSEQAAKFGISMLQRLEASVNPEAKEHFGFRDGISQPILPGLGKEGTPHNPEVALGEFVLGYENAYFETPDSPILPKSMDQAGDLSEFAAQPGWKDFGRNGSYLVFRQLKQDVAAFWKFAMDAVKKENPAAGLEEAVQLASKMVGRWPSGAPITLCPHADKAGMEEENEFGYHENDLQGFNCPAGSHIRRTNPRDALQGSKVKSAMKISQRHRILRRGRNYGPPLAESMEAADLVSAPDDGQERGLLFICLNTNIARQFEFVQHTWADNTKFEGLYDDPDPILGIKDSRNKAETHDFTIPQMPIRRKVQGLRRNVQVVGGAYFFLPSLSAIRFISNYHPKA